MIVYRTSTSGRVLRQIAHHAVALLRRSDDHVDEGLGAVVAGGLLVSTIFTIVLVPLVLSVVMRDRRQATEAREGS